MGAKRSILEKLKLIEKIEEQNEISIEKSDYTNENKSEDSTIAVDTTNAEVNEQIDYSNEVSVTSTNIEDVEIKKEYNENMSLDKALTIEEIYKRFSLEENNTKTIFIVDEFFKALPVNLPTEVKKQSVVNIITASNMNLEGILNDGNNRLHILDGFLKDFSRNTNESIIKYQVEIEQLTKEIENLKQHINKKEKLHEEQKAIIEFEMQKIDSIIHAIK